MAIATAAITIALALRYALLPQQAGYAFLTFYPAVLFCFIYCGPGPSALASMASAVLGCWIFAPDLHGDGGDTAIWTSASIFLASCFLTGRWTTHVRASLEMANQAENDWSRLARNTPAMMHSIDRSGNIIAVSDMWLDKMGYCREEVVGCQSSDFLSAESRAYALSTVLPEFFTRGRVENVEYQMVRKDGGLIEVLLSAILERDHNGQALRSIAILVDVTSRKEAENMLAESERRYRALVEDQSEMVSLSELDGTLTFVNRAYANHFGHSPESMTGTSLFDYIPEPDRRTVAELLASVSRSGGIVNSENPMLSADRTGLRWVAWTNRALLDGQRRVTKIHSVGRDITEKKQLEIQLIANTREIEDLYENAPCGYHSVGSDGNYLRINATELEWLGCDRADVIGLLSPRDFFGLRDRELVTATFQHAKDTGQTQRTACRLIGRNGVQRDVSLSMSVVKGDDGAFLMTRSVMFDITAQKDAERAVQRLNNEQLRILESDLFGIARLRNRHFLWGNRGLCRMLGYDPGELSGLAIRQCYPDDESYRALGDAAYPLLKAGGTYHAELTLRRKDDAAIWVEMTGVMLDGSNDESLWLFADITERKRIELALQSSQSLLERTGQAAGVGGWEYDLQTRALYWTAETRRLHGVPDDFQPSVETAIEFYTPEARPVIKAAVEAAITEGKAYDLELQVIRADGVLVWVRTMGNVDLVDGQPVRLVGAFQDVTDQVQQIVHIKSLYAVAEQQRSELAGYRHLAQAEAEIAGFLLRRLSRIEQLDEAAVQYYWQPAESISGDIIAVARSSAGATYGMLADATGHGLAAAINLIPLTGAFYAMAAKGFSLVTICEQLNKVVQEYSLADRFVAVVLTRVRHREKLLEVVNAGNPAALLLDGSRKVVRHFRSGSIPLGILGQTEFKPTLEVVELDGNESVLIYSDGLVEAVNVDGHAFGKTGIDEALRLATDNRDIARSIGELVQDHSAGRALADDVSVLVLPVKDRVGDPGFLGSWGPDTAGMDSMPTLGDGHVIGDDVGWSLNLRFTSQELKIVEIVPLAVNIARTFGLPRTAESALFTVMSELIQNALDHGLLRLESGLKAEPNGFDRYLELRAARLTALSSGEIGVHFESVRLDAQRACLRIVVVDSGPGFDHKSRLHAIATAESEVPSLNLSGRGLALVRNLCRSITFNERGNEAKVELIY